MGEMNNLKSGQAKIVQLSLNSHTHAGFRSYRVAHSIYGKGPFTALVATTER